MKRRDFIAAGALSAAALTLPKISQVNAASGDQPNVLMIAIDDLNHWVGYLNTHPQTKTPNLDRLAKMGVWFSHSYGAAPVCNASRASLMAGLRPSSTGVYRNENDWRRVIPQALTLCTTFRNAGYEVLGAGKVYHYNRREEWDDYLIENKADPVPPGSPGVGIIKFGVVNANDEDFRDWRIANYGIQQLQRSHDKPFFLALGFHRPHLPWYVPKKYYDLHPIELCSLPPYKEDDLADVPDMGVYFALLGDDHANIIAANKWNEAIQGYLATISYCDAMVGRVLDAYEASPSRDQTILCLWSDNGWHLGEKNHWTKFALWEEATRSPLIWVVPPGVQGATPTPIDAECSRCVDFMSIYPTLADLCNIPIPAHVEGKSIRSLLANPSAPWSDPAIMTYTYKCHAVRSETRRYIRYADGGEELYNETIDRNEWNNLASNLRYAGEKRNLARWLPKINRKDIGGTLGRTTLRNKLED